MATSLLRTPKVLLARIEESDLPEAQQVFDRAIAYHRRMTGAAAPSDAAQRCYSRPAPKPKKGIRTFKYLLGILPTPKPGADVGDIIGVVDCFVGYPQYDIATMATFIMSPDRRREGLSAAAIAAIVTWMKRDHPAVRWLDASITDDNLPATKFLMHCGFARTNSWYPVDVQASYDSR